MDICCYVSPATATKVIAALTEQIKSVYPEAALDIFRENGKSHPAPRKVSVWDWDRGGWFRDQEAEARICALLPA